MTYERLHATFVAVVATLVGSIVVAELAGYWLHRLLHSDKFPALSRGHLIHHFLIYGPRQPMRAEEYQDATDGVVCYDADFYPYGGGRSYTNTCPQNYKFEGRKPGDRKPGDRRNVS